MTPTVRGAFVVACTLGLTACAPPPLELSYQARTHTFVHPAPDETIARAITIGATVRSVSTGLASTSISGEMSTLTARLDDGAQIPGDDVTRCITLRYHAGLDQPIMDVRRGDRLIFRFADDGRFVDVSRAE